MHLNGNHKARFDKVMGPLHSRRSENSTKTLNLKLLCCKEEGQWSDVHWAAIQTMFVAEETHWSAYCSHWIPAMLFKIGRKTHSLPGSVVSDQNINRATAAICSKYGLHSDHVGLVRKAILIIVAKAFIMDIMLFNLFSLLLKDHRCY